jgi:hypothetical protein
MTIESVLWAADLLVDMTIDVTKRRDMIRDGMARVLMEEGREEGLAEGERNGRVEILLKLLTARFGRVPADAKAKVLAATPQTLDRWALRALTAASLQAVLGTSAPPLKKTARPRRTTRTARA